MGGYVVSRVWYDEMPYYAPQKRYPEPPKGLSFKALKLLGAAYLSARVG